MISLLAMTLLAPSADAHHGRATIDVDNVLRSTVTVWVDGVAVGAVAPRQRVAFSIRPGAREVELVQRNRNCVLTDDFVHLPPRAEVTYRVDQSCGPRPVYFVQARPRPGVTVTWTPSTFRVVRHWGPVVAPRVVVTPRRVPVRRARPVGRVRHPARRRW
ncbi:MAG: hypothetical protein AAF211_21010 [Myxococcota bacterium]